MNSKLKTKKITAIAAALLLSVMPSSSLFAQSDDFGIWTSLEAKKKLTERLDVKFEGELRTIDGVQQTDRRSFGVGMSYEIAKWLKAEAGYIYIESYNPQEKSLKEYVGDDEFGNPVHNYNIDHAYWEQRDRFVFTLTASHKIGRIKLSLRERLQYQHTHSALTYEDKYRYTFDMLDPNNPYPILPEDAPNSDAELKDGKHNTVLRSRLTAKWDIKKCKIEPFASVELFTRLDEWRGHDKLRYRVGASYKIDKDNEVSFYYQFQDNKSSKSPALHAIGVGYSFDL